MAPPVTANPGFWAGALNALSQICGGSGSQTSITSRCENMFNFMSCCRTTSCCGAGNNEVHIGQGNYSVSDMTKINANSFKIDDDDDGDNTQQMIQKGKNKIEDVVARQPTLTKVSSEPINAEITIPPKVVDTKNNPQKLNRLDQRGSGGQEMSVSSNYFSAIDSNPLDEGNSG